MSTTSLRPRIRVLSDEDVVSIVADACRVLEVIGVRLDNDDARTVLADAGATEKDGRTLLPEKLVRDAVASAPRRIPVYDRDGALAMDLGDDRVHFDPGSAAIWFLDPKSAGGRREPRTADLVALARLVDGLPHYAAQSTALVPNDVPREVGDRIRLWTALRWGKKPVVTGTFAKEAFRPMHAMLAAVRGGAEELADRPLAIFDCCPSPPLQWSDLTAQALVDCARTGVPAELVSMPLTGATAPVTLREAIVQHTAECLSGVAIHQRTGRGAPIVWGGSPAAFDMRHGTTPMGAAETMLIDVGYAQVGKHLGLPTHAYMGLSDAKCLDYQAGFETSAGAIVAALAGINVISGPGMMDFESMQSFEKLLLDHDAVGMALRLVRGVETRACDLLALFGALAATGELLSSPHTRKNHRLELTLPSALVERGSWSAWREGGARRAEERATLEVERRLAGPATVTLDAERTRKVDEIMRADLARHGVERLPGV